MQRRILIVEDHADTAEGLAEVLAAWGYEPHIAGDGRQALALASALQPDVVISDLGLPDIDGIELGRRLRLLPAGRGTVLVAVSGSNRDDASDSPFDHRFVKPVDLAALERLLESASRRNEVTDSGPAQVRL